MQKRSALFSLCIFSLGVFSYGIASEFLESKVSECEQTFPFVQGKPKVTVLEAVHRAAEDHDPNTLRLLFDKDKMSARFGISPATEEEVNSFLGKCTPLMRSLLKKTKLSREDAFDTVTVLLEQGARVDLYDKAGKNALMYGVQFQCGPDILEKLASHARDSLDAKDFSGNRAVDYAEKSPEQLRVLMRAGANLPVKWAINLFNRKQQ